MMNMEKITLTVNAVNDAPIACVLNNFQDAAMVLYFKLFIILVQN